MEAIAATLPRERLMTGTGASALHDAIELTRGALSLGFAAALVIPPFYYREIPDEGVMRFFDELFSRVAPGTGQIFLYNFPRMSGVTFHAGLVDRLLARYPGLIGGMKDSSNDLVLERELHERHPEFAILPGSEELLPEVIADGLAGCISGSVCLWPELAAQAWHQRDMTKAAEVRDFRKAMAMPFIPTVRARVAAEQKNDAWLRAVPPLSP
jgi:4-hydroxy-tetrahydrodipicolinate synthase